MPLLDLKTNLKSLKYGQDRPGGGDSRQPYITTDINTVDTGFNRLRLTKFDDGLIRGGVVGVTNAAIVDTLRIGKFFLDAPKGPLFLIKQVGLQLSNPKLETKQLSTNSPTSGQGFLNNVGNLISNVANTITNAVGPTRIYNLGINTLAQVPVNAIGGHIVRHGLLPIQTEDTKYFSVAQSNNQNGTNRLLGLSTKFKLGDGKLNDSIDKGLIGSINQSTSNLLASRGLPAGPASFLSINKDDATIDDYLGGSSSVYGIGRTLIKRYDNTEDVARIDPLITYSNIFAGATRNAKGDPEKVKIKNTRDFLLSTPFYQKSDLNSKSWKYEDGNSLDSSFLNSIASDKDKNGINVANQKNSYNDAIQRAQSGFFYGVSNYSSSIYVSGSNLIDNSGISASLDSRIASAADKSHTRNSSLPDILGENDLVNNGPSSYPNSQGLTGLNSLKLPNLIYSPQAGSTSSYVDVESAINKLTAPNNVGIYKTLINGQKNLERLPTSTFNNPTYENAYGEVVKVNLPWNKATRERRVGSGRQDEINLTPIFEETAYFGNDTAPGSGKNIRDLIRLRIQAVNTDNPENGKWMVFRAYLTDLSDDTTAEWSDIKYAGRGDKFYIYTGFTRKISISFQVAALSEKEMKFIYQKLNFLMSNAMPEYKDSLMRGPLVRMSVGSWIDSQLGILNSVNIKPNKESPWEIAIGDDQLILPHVLDVTLNFTPIGSETRASNLIQEKSETTSHIAQNNTGDVKMQYIGT